MVPGLCYGRTDVELAAPVGPVIEQLAGFRGLIWSSPSARCRAVAAALGPHTVDPRLLELDFGIWEGMLWDNVPRAALDAWAADVHLFSPPGGESGAALIARVRSFHADLPPGDHIVVSHGGPLKVLAALLRGQIPDLHATPQPLGSVVFTP